MFKPILNYASIILWTIMLFFDHGHAKKYDLSPYASWNQNASIIAGCPNGTNGSTTSQLARPIGISISSDDILYVSDTYNHRIVVISLTNTSETLIIKPNSTEFNLPYNTFPTNRSLYVSVNGHQVWNISIANKNVTSVALSNLSYSVTYLYVDIHDNIYWTDQNNHMVLVWNVTTKNVSIVAGNGTNGTDTNQLNQPCGIFVDDNETVYVADCHNHRIMKWFAGESSGMIVAGNGTAGNDCTQLHTPTQIIMDENKYMYISESDNQRITRWAPNSTCGVCIVACTGNASTAPTDLYHPHSLAFDRKGSLYVSNVGSHRVQKFEILNHHSILYHQPKLFPCGSWKSKPITIANISTVVSQLFGIFVNVISRVCRRNTNISKNNDISAAKISGKFIISRNLFIKINGSIYLDNSDFKYSFDDEIFNLADCFVALKFVHRCITIFIATNNTIYCSLNTEHRVVTLLQNHSSCVEITSAGNGTNDSMSHSLNDPHGIFVDINLNLYVADSGNDRIQFFQFENRTGFTIAGNKDLKSIGLKYPTAVVLDTYGYLYIADYGHQRIIQSHENGFRCILGCKRQNQLHFPQALWFDSFGNIFILNENNTQIKRFALSKSSCGKTSSACLGTLTCWNSIRFGFNCSYLNTYCDLYKPCQNGGTCYNNATIDRKYICICPSNFNGIFCEKDDRLCKPNTCWNHGTCNDKTPKNLCTCAPGWEGIHCEKMINYCHNITCKNQGVCRPLLMNYICECLNGSYSGKHCEITAQKIIFIKNVGKSFSYVAIIAVVCVVMFVISMDILKYGFGIDPAREDLEHIQRAKRINKVKPFHSSKASQETIIIVEL